MTEPYPLSTEPGFPVAVMVMSFHGSHLFGPFWTAAALEEFENRYLYLHGQIGTVFPLNGPERIEVPDDEAP